MSDTVEETAQALIGKTLGAGYRLEALIGQGAMGAVFRARGPDGREVAVKTLNPELMRGETSQRFLRESELVRGLKHPHVVQTLDAGVDSENGVLFLVMPLLRGRDLDRVLEELGALQPESAVRIALQAARGLSAAHRIGIIHRDVKPGNLILDEEEREIIVRVCDFGIAKQVGGQEALTTTGSQLGTPDYVSPEQLKSSKHVDERTDVWSLGATLYQMLCGAAPFAHIESVFDLIAAIVSEDVPHIQDRAPWLDGALSFAVHKALRRDPNQRWATLEDFADALRPFAGGDELLDSARIRAVSPETRAELARRVDLRGAPVQTSLAASAPALDELGLTGQTLAARYLVKRLIGKGGTGSVYEVETATGERLAAKVVSAGTHGASPSTLQRFAREAKAVRAINSVNVVRTVDAGCDEKLGYPYIVMELLSGVDLSSVLKREGALSPEVAVRLVLQAARGVAAAHARGVVHRDIKPANLFLQQDPKSSEVDVKVCDFGVAKRTSGVGSSSSAGQHSLTRPGGLLGSPMYMSPEQAKNAKTVDERTDIWSLSVVLWEALSGQRLWDGQTSLGQLVMAICTQPVKRLESVAPWIPRGLTLVVHRGLEREPKQRTPTVQALLEQLAPFTSGSDRVVVDQLRGLTEEQRAELTLKVKLSDSSARDVRSLGRQARGRELGQVSTIDGSARERSVERGGGASKTAMVTVALLSAAIAGGSAFFFAGGYTVERVLSSVGSRLRLEPSAAVTPARAQVNVRVTISPKAAKVTTRDGVRAVTDGEITLGGMPGETLEVVLEHGGASKRFAVSLGSDGLATPSRLVLTPREGRELR